MLSKKAPPFWYLKSPASQPGAISLCFIIQQAERGRKTDKVYLLLCLFSSGMAVLALASWAAKQGNGFAVDGRGRKMAGCDSFAKSAQNA